MSEYDGRRSALTRRSFLGLAGAGIAAGVAGAGAVAWSATTDATGAIRDPDLLPGDAAHGWIRAVYKKVWDGGSATPTNAARIYNYVALTMFEAVAPASNALRSMAGQLTDLHPLPKADPSQLDPVCVMAAAVRDVTDYLFRDAPTPGTELEDLYHLQLRARRNAGVSAGTVSASTEHGVRLARELITWISTDGYQGSLRPYTPPVGEGLWRPSPPNPPDVVGPYFSEVRPMVLTSNDEVAPVAPVPYSAVQGSPFWEQANATYQTGLTLTQEQRLTAMFWRDNPHTSGLPSGHWMQITRQFCTQQDMNLTRSVEAYARLGVALHDAFLNCWTWKYRYNVIRPVDYVHDHIDPNWQTWVNTPQFPEYTSGHSVASAAAATVLTDLFGEVPFTDVNSIVDWGTRSFSNFRQAATEAAVSRRYGGIHYPMAIENGMTQGDAVGGLVIGRLHTRR